MNNAITKGKEFLSQLKLYSDYLKWNNDKNRFETWEEACDDVLNTHIEKHGDKVKNLVEEVKPLYYAKEFLPSQRSLQFRGKHILKNNAKLYNCCVSYAYSPDVFNKGFFVLLSGTGLGISLKKKFVKQLPSINSRDKGAKNYIVEDSIEGWSEAARVIISSYCKHSSLLKEYFGYQIKFDFSNIREKGAYISGGFKAPGPDGLRQSLERIEKLLNDNLQGKEQTDFSSIIAYDILMHLSDAVLSGGVRRSAMNIVMDKDDTELVNAKVGNWRSQHPHRARSNNSVQLIRNQFTEEEFKKLIELNTGDNDLGFVFSSHEDDMYNPCFEIGFNFYEKIKNKNEAVFQFCNLTEINAASSVDKQGRFSETKFYELCRAATIVGTLQASYTEFKYLGSQTEDMVSGEALLGVSVTGWMTRPELFNPDILQKGAGLCKKVNKEVADIIGINYAARITTTKPSGNASVILKTASGIHPEHSKRYFRIMQLNKESEIAKYLEENMPDLLEESNWSSTKSDYVVFVPVENEDGTLYKDQMTGIKHLELIKLVQEHWVVPGTNKDRCYISTTTHNVSNTVIIDNIEEIKDYIYKNQNIFAAVSFISNTGDKDYTQAPFTSVLTSEELLKEYGDAVIFMSGLIVDGLHYFNNNLWDAADHALNKLLPLTGTREQVILKKDWIRRVEQFSKNYFKKDLKRTIYCMKDVHLFHKWSRILRTIKYIDFTEVLKQPTYADIDKYAAISCSGGACEIDFSKRD